MCKLKHFVYGFCLLISIQASHAQLGFTHELGVVLGPVQFRSDYGVRNSSETNFGNTGFGFGIVHYMNFTYRKYLAYRNNNYFTDHFKLRNEISWNKTNLEHFGEWVDPSKTSENAKRLRGHEGVASNFDIGTQLEFFPLSIPDFEAFEYALMPYLGIGVHYTFYSPEVSTSYDNPNSSAIGNVNDPSNFYSGWDPGSVDASPGGTFSLILSAGTRYKLSAVSDLVLDLRWQYYGNDWIDGLNHQLDSNKYNDWLLWVNVGYIYYLN